MKKAVVETSMGTITLVLDTVTAAAVNLGVDERHHTMRQQGKSLLISGGGLSDG